MSYFGGNWFKKPSTSCLIKGRHWSQQLQETKLMIKGFDERNTHQNLEQDDQWKESACDKWVSIKLTLESNESQWVPHTLQDCIDLLRRTLLTSKTRWHILRFALHSAFWIWWNNRKSIIYKPVSHHILLPQQASEGIFYLDFAASFYNIS